MKRLVLNGNSMKKANINKRIPDYNLKPVPQRIGNIINMHNMHTTTFTTSVYIDAKNPFNLRLHIS